MSNVIKASSAYVGTDQQGVVGKIYEELFTDSNGNTTVRYLRIVKNIDASISIKVGELCRSIATGSVNTMHLNGHVEQCPITNLDNFCIAGVALQEIPAGSFGWVCCRGVVELVVCHTNATTIGMNLVSYGATTLGMVQYDDPAGAGESIHTVGCVLVGVNTALTPDSCTAYINVL